jgi:serine/threonine protein kinase
MSYAAESSTACSLQEASNFDFHSFSVDFSEHLGKGATAIVYRARNRNPVDEPSELALKVLLAKTSDEKHNDKLRQEIDILAGLTSSQQHPNIVGFYGVCMLPAGTMDDMDHWALQVDFCSGGDLHSRTAIKRFSELEAHGVMCGLLAGLEHMHSHGFIHRDVKPENVLLTSSGTVKLTDFGVSARMDDAVELKAKRGSPGYVAPEVWLGMQYDIKVDSFSAGALLHFIISGKLAFSGSTVESVGRKTLKDPVKFRRSICLERLSGSCKAFMELLLAKNPLCRPTAAEALTDIWTVPKSMSMPETEEYDLSRSTGISLMSERSTRDSDRCSGRHFAAADNLEECVANSEQDLNLMQEISPADYGSSRGSLHGSCVPRKPAHPAPPGQVDKARLFARMRFHG